MSVRARRGRQPVAASPVQPGMAAAPAAAAPAPQPVPRFRDLRLRILSALVLGPIGLGAIAAGGLAWWAALSVAFGLMAEEWAGLCGVARPLRIAAIAIVLGAGAALQFAGPEAAGAAWAAGAALLLAAARPRLLAAGIAYLGMALLALLALRAAPHGRTDTFFLALTVWGSDIGGYAAGRLLGGPRLAPSISPGKTWAGALGALAAATAVGLAFAAWGGRDAALCLAAALLGIVSQAGDLLESAAKRHFGAKDSGRLIPGHGGVLDRLDALIAAAPLAFLLMLSGNL